MYGYVALCLSAADDQGARAAAIIEQRIRTAQESWELVFADAGLRVFQRGANRGVHKALSLGDSGAVLGTIFPNLSDAHLKTERPTFSETTVQNIRSTNGKYLVDHYWGTVRRIFSRL